MASTMDTMETIIKVSKEYVRGGASQTGGSNIWPKPGHFGRTPLFKILNDRSRTGHDFLRIWCHPAKADTMI